MKNIILLATLTFSPVLLTSGHFQLSNATLRTVDSAGMFDKPLLDILKVRGILKEFLYGKLDFKGLFSSSAAQMNLMIVDELGSPLATKLQLVLRRPELIFGATFVILSPDHPQLFKLVAQRCTHDVTVFAQQVRTSSKLARHEHPNFQAVFTGHFAVHPLTHLKLPIFVSDYALENFDNRMTKAHLAIPAHDAKDFAFAHKNHLSVSQVVTSPEEGKSTSPHVSKGSGELLSAYTGEYDDSIIINSDFANGSVKHASEKVIAQLKTVGVGSEYKEKLTYQIGSQLYCLADLQALELNKMIKSDQKEIMSILMIQAQADFLSLVEQFLINAKEAKDLMISLIEESCKLRGNKNSYLLRWTRLSGTESERAVFKRDIKTFNDLAAFSTDLINFLTDFAYSCPHALENLKSLKNK